MVSEPKLMTYIWENITPMGRQEECSKGPKSYKDFKSLMRQAKMTKIPKEHFIYVKISEVGKKSVGWGWQYTSWHQKKLRGKTNIPVYF